MVNAGFIHASQRDVNGRCDKTKALGLRGRDVQRKVFRIEQMFGGGHGAAAEQRPAVDDAADTLKHELTQIHDTIARNKRELALLIGDGKERRMARAADELRAAVDGMDDATQKILKSVEVIDESARALTATLKDDYKRGVAQDIQDHVVQIYEACNFQDIAGQRISNVIGTMTMVEDQVAAMLDRVNAIDPRNEPPAPAPDHELLNGPKLDGDSGHANQDDIDKMFG
jgi:chemotaxis protein CheZ